MKRKVMLLVGILCFFALTACQPSDEKQAGAANHKETDTTIIEMTLDKNYDDADPFINARLFRVADELDTLSAKVSLQMDGETGLVEIKEHATEEVLWSKTWTGSVDHENIAISLEHLNKENDYAICFTGTKINKAIISVTFEPGTVHEQEQPSK